jgi:hypothetical protein
MNKKQISSPNRMVYVRRLTAARLRKTPVGLTPFVVFCSATFLRLRGKPAVFLLLQPQKRHIPPKR